MEEGRLLARLARLSIVDEALNQTGVPGWSGVIFEGKQHRYYTHLFARLLAAGYSNLYYTILYNTRLEKTNK